MDATPLQAAHARFLALARSGRFAPPAVPGQWNAEQVLVHVATTDRLLIARTAELLAGGTPVHDNAPARRTDYLDSLIDASGDFLQLTALAQAAGMELVALVRRLTDEQAQAPVIVVDEPHPWGEVLRHHAEVHLPSHIAQLEALAVRGARTRSRRPRAR